MSAVYLCHFNPDDPPLPLFSPMGGRGEQAQEQEMEMAMSKEKYMGKRDYKRVVDTGEGSGGG